MPTATDDQSWQRLEALMTGRDYIALALAVVDLGAAELPGVTAAMRAYVRPAADGSWRSLDEAGLAIIGAGVLRARAVPIGTGVA